MLIQFSAFSMNSIGFTIQVTNYKYSVPILRYDLFDGVHFVPVQLFAFVAMGKCSMLPQVKYCFRHRGQSKINYRAFCTLYPRISRLTVVIKLQGQERAKRIAKNKTRATNYCVSFTWASIFVI